MGKLVHFHANGTVRDIRLDRERMTIGRRPDNDLCLPQPPVSGAHAAVVTILSDSFLEDLGSTNGTLVNGKAITKCFLRDGDEIDIGREILVYLVDDSATVEVPPRMPERALVAVAPKGEESPVQTDSGSFAAGEAIARGKRRSDAPATPEIAAAVDHEAAPAGSDGGAVVPPIRPGVGEPERGRAAANMPTAGPDPAIRVLSGARAGSVVALTRPETLIGRAGVQVAALKRDGGEIRIVPVEGASRPSVNGAPIAAEGQRLAPGDILEIAGARLEVLPRGAPGA